MKSREAYIGIGFYLGVEAAEIERAICRFLEELGIELKKSKGCVQWTSEKQSS
jgi:cobalamin biosynthesis protein CbiG